MKRILSLLFTAVMTILMISVVSAADAAGTADIVLSSETAVPGGQVTVTVTLNDNPGLTNLQLDIVYPESLTLNSVTKGDALKKLALTQGGEKKSPFTLLWNGAAADNSTGTTLAQLVFAVPEDAVEGEKYEISVSIPEYAVIDENLEYISLTTSGCEVSVEIPKMRFSQDDFAFENISVEYNGTKQTPELIYKNGADLPEGYKVTYSITPRNCGTYQIPVLVQAVGYDPITLTTSFTINPIAANIKIGSVKADVGDGYELTYSCTTEFVGGDFVSGTPSVETDGIAGNYTITQGSLRIIDGESGKTSQNYNVNIVEGILTLENVPDTEIALNITEVELKEGESVQLAAIFTPVNTTIKDINWTVSNDNVTVVNGLVTAGNLESGYSATATVTATSAESNKAICNVTVVCNHHLEYVNAVAATCTENGSIAHYKCPDCGKLFGDNYAAEELTADAIVTAIDSSNHAYETEIDGQKNATEDTEGFTGNVKCSGCKQIIKAGTSIPALAHQHTGITHHKAVPATCLKEGSVEYWTCSSSKCRGIYYGDVQCKSILNTVVTAKDPAGHTMETELVNFKQVTCTENGYTGDTVYSCCGTLVSGGEKVSAQGHQVSDVWVIEDTVHYKVCSVCHSEVMYSEHSAAGATCTEDSVCAVCGYITEEAHGHKFSGEHKNLEIYKEQKEASCVTEGTIASWKCTECNNLFTKNAADEPIPATEEGIRIAPKGHVWGEWGENINGFVTRHCTDCFEASETRKVVEGSNKESGLTFDVYMNESDQTADLEIKLTTTNFNNITGGEVKIDVTNITSESIENGKALSVKQVSIPTTAVKSVADNKDADTLAVELTTGSVAFNGDALSTLNAGEGSVSLKVEPVAGDSVKVVSQLKDGMNNDQVNTVNDKLGGREVLGAVDLSLDLVSGSQNTALGKSEKDDNGEEKGGFGDGSVTISIPFTPKDATKTQYKMVYIHEDGTTEERNATYDSGKLTFTVTHFSQFIVVDPMVDVEDDATYALLSTAVEKCDDGGTITLLGDINETVEIKKNLTIMKGDFSADNIKAGEGFVLNKEGDKYVISKAAASIGNHYFASLSEAIANAANDKTINLYESYTGEKIKIGKPINIELANGVSAKIEADVDAGIIEKAVGNTYTYVKAAAMIETAEKKLHETIEDAIEDAANGAVIKLMKKSEESITLNKPVTIDLNGFTIGEVKGGSDTQQYGNKQITVYWDVVENTAARKYTAVLLGDTDADNVLEESDISTLQDYFAGNASDVAVKTVEENLNQLDVDGNDKLTRRDLMILSRYLAGWNGYGKLPYQVPAN